eukprot:COSAG01_NODE_12405_length_1746_cov_1.185185_2_plen_179_part_00
MLGGDFNATREEFVHGNGPAFYACAATQQIRPALAAPAAGAAVLEVNGAEAPEQAAAEEAELASLAVSDGALRLRCAAADGGWLSEASKAGLLPAGGDGGGAAAACTRAGRSIVIDFVLCGGVGMAAGELTTAPHALASEEESSLAADPATGIYEAVQRWGSDHLPVCADVQLLRTKI